ncbi:MAG: hypothetical protein GOU98_02455 [Candidatus Altiarchaeota archaeon]|nr:hypothetical protein [Candidatus Altiarchaeota archaeon]
MSETKKNIWTALIILVITVSFIYLMPLTGYLKAAEEHHLVGWQPNFIFAFLIFNIATIGFPFWIHWLYISDYGTIKGVWFFAIFGGITGAILGEVLPKGASFVLIIPYTILCLIYAKFYKKYTWWKVALTTYLAGMLIENGMNRAPIQIPTLMWIAFFTYPYFWTKILEHRNKLPLGRITLGLLTTSATSFGLAYLVYFLIRWSSPPLVVLAGVLPFIVKFVKVSIKRYKTSVTALG